MKIMKKNSSKMVDLPLGHTIEFTAEIDFQILTKEYRKCSVEVLSMCDTQYVVSL